MRAPVRWEQACPATHPMCPNYQGFSSKYPFERFVEPSAWRHISGREGPSLSTVDCGLLCVRFEAAKRLRVVR